MSEAIKKLGVCSVCQTSGHVLDTDLDGSVIVDQHDFFGEPCAGSFMAPETTYEVSVEV